MALSKFLMIVKVEFDVIIENEDNLKDDRMGDHKIGFNFHGFLP
jgi:hypothetical protein